MMNPPTTGTNPPTVTLTPSDILRPIASALASHDPDGDSGDLVEEIHCIMEQYHPVTKPHRASLELWAAAEKWGANTMDMANCFLELRDRIVVLEAAQHKLDRLIALDRDDPTNSLVDRIATDAELCQVYNEGAATPLASALRAVYDLGRQHAAAPTRPGPAGSAPDTDARQLMLVERVLQRMFNTPSPSPLTISPNQVRAAILEVSAAALQMHPDNNLTWERVALWLEQEANL